MAQKVFTVFDFDTISYGYFSKSYFESERTWHLGVDITIPQGTPIGATVEGEITRIGGTGSNSYIFLWDGSITHIFGHVTPSVNVGQCLTMGGLVGTIAPYPASAPHLHYGINRNRNLTLDGNWGWGRTGVASATKVDAANRGWMDPRLALFSISQTRSVPHLMGLKYQ